MIATDRRRLWPQRKRSGPHSTRAPACNYSFVQSRTIRARAIFPIYAKTTAARVKAACRHAPMKIHKSKSCTAYASPRRRMSACGPKATSPAILGLAFKRFSRPGQPANIFAQRFIRVTVIDSLVVPGSHNVIPSLRVPSSASHPGFISTSHCATRHSAQTCNTSKKRDCGGS